MRSVLQKSPVPSYNRSTPKKKLQGTRSMHSGLTLILSLSFLASRKQSLNAECSRIVLDLDHKNSINACRMAGAFVFPLWNRLCLQQKREKLWSIVTLRYLIAISCSLGQHRYQVCEARGPWTLDWLSYLLDQIAYRYVSCINFECRTWMRNWSAEHELFRIDRDHKNSTNWISNGRCACAVCAAVFPFEIDFSRSG